MFKGSSGALPSDTKGPQKPTETLGGGCPPPALSEPKAEKLEATRAERQRRQFSGGWAARVCCQAASQDAVLAPPLSPTRTSTSTTRGDATPAMGYNEEEEEEEGK